MRLMTTMMIAALCRISLGAQTFTPSTNPVSDTVREMLARDSKSLIASAELLPADKYGYRPTPAQMTFGQLFAHVVQTNIALCSALSDAAPPMTGEELKKLTGTDPKETIVAKVKQSFDYCTDVMAKVTDAHLADETTMFGRRTGRSRASVMITIASDWADHYSTAASYLRLNDILPPTAQPQK